MNTGEIPISGHIAEKITWAEYYFKNYQGQILEDKTIGEHLDGLKNAIQASHKEMGKAGILDICKECDKNEGGSCCGAGLENKYDGWLLLINLLLKLRLPKERHGMESCFFLGEGGCILKARHVICVNYLCKNITDQIDPHGLKALREKEGDELSILFLLHERLKRVLRAWMNV